MLVLASEFSTWLLGSLVRDLLGLNMTAQFFVLNSLFYFISS